MASATPIADMSGKKAPKHLWNRAFNDSDHYLEWPKVADAVIEAADYFPVNGMRYENFGGILSNCERSQGAEMRPEEFPRGFDRQQQIQQRG